MAKQVFENATRGNVYSFDPMALAIMGGLDLPENERGPLDTATDKTHPLYDERLKLKLTKEWVDNIFVHGVKEDINIAKIGDVPFVVNGRQRVRGARVANALRAIAGQPLLTVSCKLVRVDDLGMLTEMILTNIHQDDSVSTKIAKLKRLMARGVDTASAAVIFGTREQTVKAWLAYDDNAISEVKKAVNSGKIPQSTGADLARLPKDKQQGALDEILANTPAAPNRSERKGAAAKAKRTIARAGGKGSGISDKKTLKRFLEAVESVEHPKSTKPSVMEWWSGVEAALHFVLGDDGADKRLAAILAALDGVPEEASSEPTTGPTNDGDQE